MTNNPNQHQKVADELERRLKAPTRDGAEGASTVQHCSHPDYSDWDGTQPEPRPAPPKPSPDAVRTMIATLRNPGPLVRPYAKFFAEVADALESLAAPVPSPDGARREVEATLQMISNAAADAALRDPSPAVAAEPVAGWRYAHKGQGDWHVQSQDPREYLNQWPAIGYDVEPLYAIPPVRADREVPPVKRIECVKMVNCLEVEAEPLWRLEIGGICADFETETGANNFRNAILSLPVQSAPDRAILYAILSKHIPQDMIDGIWQEIQEASRGESGR